MASEIFQPVDIMHLSIRRNTSVSQKLPRDLIPKVELIILSLHQISHSSHCSQVVGFIIRLGKLRHLKQYPLSCFGNMDETLLWMDMPGETTVSRVGQRSISILTTAHDKGRSTEVLAAMEER